MSEPIAVDDWMPLYEDDVAAATLAATRLHEVCLDVVDIRRAVPALIHGLSNADGALARACAQALAGLASNGGHVELAVPALCGRLHDDDAVLADAAWLAVEELVRSVLSYPDAFRMRHNLGVLAALLDPERLPPQRQEAARDLLKRIETR